MVALLFPLLDPPPPHLHVDTHAHTQSKREREPLSYSPDFLIQSTLLILYFAAQIENTAARDREMWMDPPLPPLPRLNSVCTAVACPPCPHISLENSTQVARNEEGEGGGGGGGSPGPSSPSPLVPELPCLAACEDQVGEKGLTHVQVKFKCLSTSSLAVEPGDRDLFVLSQL